MRERERARGCGEGLTVKTEGMNRIDGGYGPKIWTARMGPSRQKVGKMMT